MNETKTKYQIGEVVRFIQYFDGRKYYRKAKVVSICMSNGEPLYEVDPSLCNFYGHTARVPESQINPETDMAMDKQRS